MKKYSKEEWEQKIEYKNLDIKHDRMVGFYTVITIITVVLIICITIILNVILK